MPNDTNGIPVHITDDGLDERWYDEHPACDGCGVRGCAHDCCTNRDGIVMLTDGTYWHPLCLVREQTVDARIGAAR